MIQDHDSLSIPPFLKHLLSASLITVATKKCPPAFLITYSVFQIVNSFVVL